MSDLADDVVKVGNEMLKLDSAVKAFQLRIQEIKDSAQASVDAALVTKAVANADMDLLHRFLAKPYLILPKTETQWYLIVPRFVDMQLGILEKQTDSFNIFVIDHYVDWITPLPRDIRDAIGMKEAPLQAVVAGGMMATAAKDTDTAWERYRPFLLRREEPGKLKDWDFAIIQAALKYYGRNHPKSKAYCNQLRAKLRRQFGDLVKDTKRLHHSLRWAIKNGRLDAFKEEDIKA